MEEPHHLVHRPRPLSGGERFLLWLGILMPGLVSPFAMIFMFGLSYSGGGKSDLWLWAIPVGWIALLLGCCWMCGWIQATKDGETNLKARAAKRGGLFLLGQLLLVPVIGFGTCMAIMAVGNR